MTLQLAILNIILGGNREMNARQILGFLPAFTAADASLGDVVAALGTLEHKGDVTGTASEDRGKLFTLTAAGRLRVANSK